jgi:hypothetical protein
MLFRKNLLLKLTGLLFIVGGIALRFSNFESAFSPFILGGLIGGGSVLLFGIGRKENRF